MQCPSFFVILTYFRIDRLEVTNGKIITVNQGRGTFFG